MSEKIKIAVDAMGGDGSPKKVIDGIIYNHQSNKNNFYKIFGDKNKIFPLIENKISKEFYEIFHTENAIKSTDSPLEGAKRGKDTSMWLAIQSVKEKQADIVISALKKSGTTVLFVEHDMEIVERYVDRVIAFYQGQVICDDTPKKALKNKKVIQYVLGS